MHNVGTNAGNFGDGIGVFGASSGNVIIDNVVQENSVPGFSAGHVAVLNRTDGIRLEPGTSDPNRPAFDLQDRNTAPPCDNNIWTDNQAGTASAACTLSRADSGAATATASSSTAAPTPARGRRGGPTVPG